MELPQRIDNHVTETASYKIFSRNIPNSWIIRDVTERDYGIDCYIEIVNKKNQVTGELISIQLKGINDLTWTKKETYNFSDVKISTTNYWRNFPTPVMLCIVDVTNELVYFEPVKSAIRKSFIKYAEQKTFSYKIQKSNELKLDNLYPFLAAYFQEKNIMIAEINTTTFISMYGEYNSFFDENYGRDEFMGIEISRILFLKHIYNNLEFLCQYYEIKWKLEPLSHYFRESQKIFGKDYYLYEYHNDVIIDKLKKVMIPILLAIREQISEVEKEYYISTNLPLFNIAINIRDNGQFPFEL
ncbi:MULTISPECIES: DUF4365 domain-containing protein [Flavobacterium]|uniref:DUF4365 domain-containing protein n=1 Tax=Flavobacterium hankyongi TaxID=1176532 RepID=A0ABP8ZR09_9FLAO|nr:DUF4365 domain-containing protein [Flavobacterium sp. N1846]